MTQDQPGGFFLVPPQIPKRPHVTAEGIARTTTLTGRPITATPPREMDKFVDEWQDDFLSLVHALELSGEPRELRRRASLHIRCASCSGRMIAWVIWLAGIPLVVGERKPGSKTLTINLAHDDGHYTTPTAWCAEMEHVLERSLLLSKLPQPGRQRATLVVEHADT